MAAVRRHAKAMGGRLQHIALKQGMPLLQAVNGFAKSVILRRSTPTTRA
jgi:hypothetical protein